MKARFTPQAIVDIAAVYDVIALVNPSAAQDVEDYIRKTADDVAGFPGIGAPTNSRHVRRLPLVRYGYTLFYRIVIADDVVDILRIVPARKIRNLVRVPRA